MATWALRVGLKPSGRDEEEREGALIPAGQAEGGRHPLRLRLGKTHLRLSRVFLLPERNWLGQDGGESGRTHRSRNEAP